MPHSASGRMVWHPLWRWAHPPMLLALHIKTARYEQCPTRRGSPFFRQRYRGLEALLDPDQCPNLAAETDDSQSAGCRVESYAAYHLIKVLTWRYLWARLRGD